MEILHSHANVVAQFDFDDPHFGGINPYALGFAMMQDIQRICSPADRGDREWFPDRRRHDDWPAVLRDIWANYRDELFVRQFLSPASHAHVQAVCALRQGLRIAYRIEAIHDADGYRHVRNVARGQL